MRLKFRLLLVTTVDPPTNSVEDTRLLGVAAEHRHGQRLQLARAERALLRDHLDVDAVRDEPALLLELAVLRARVLREAPARRRGGERPSATRRAGEGVVARGARAGAAGGAGGGRGAHQLSETKIFWRPGILYLARRIASST